MKKQLSFLLVAALILSLVLAGCGGNKPAETPAEKDMVVGFIYVGPIGDGGYTFAHNEGRLHLEQELGVKTLYKENVAEEDQEVMNAVADMIDQGATVVFATSFGHMDGLEKASKEYPEVAFMHCSGFKMTENMGNYFGRMYQARYLSGIVAGLKTETNNIGYVGAFEIPEVVRGLNAFTLGVKSVNPEAVVNFKTTQTWYDPATEKEAAKALLDAGADVIAQHQDTAGPQQAAEEAGAFSIGYNTDMKAAAPGAYMTAPIWNWGPYYVTQVQAVIDGTWKAESYWGGMADEIVALAPLTELAPAEAAELIEAAKAKFISGETDVFVGPINDNEGNLKIAEGQKLTDEEMLSMDWYVEGVKK
ncbi:MAG: BMP family ABC transporter substrate-binding protein [Clostridia bacterium]|nr:BMP family ABC transporter substrate-binding protein [Clostridia bacterium]